MSGATINNNDYCTWKVPFTVVITILVWRQPAQIPLANKSEPNYALMLHQLLWFTKPMFADWMVWFPSFCLILYIPVYQVFIGQKQTVINCPVSHVFTLSFHCLAKICINPNQCNLSFILRVSIKLQLQDACR